jgi:hypothetical protein
MAGIQSEENFSRLRTCTSPLKPEQGNHFSVRFPRRTITSGRLIYTFILFSWDSYNYASRRQRKMCLMTHTQISMVHHNFSNFPSHVVAVVSRCGKAGSLLLTSWNVRGFANVRVRNACIAPTPPTSPPAINFVWLHAAKFFVRKHHQLIQKLSVLHQAAMFRYRTYNSSTRGPACREIRKCSSHPLVQIFKYNSG